MKNLGIVGAGDLGQLIAHYANYDSKYKVTGFFDDFNEKGSLVSGTSVIGGTDEILEAFNNHVFDELIIGIGYKHLSFRKKIFELFCSQIPMATIVHPYSYIDPTCKIGSGVFILPGCVIDRNVIVNNNVLLNLDCVVSHDSSVGAHSFISPSVKIAGFVSLGECCNIGINTTVIDNIKIISNTQTGAGAVVISDINDPGLYIGNPAKKIK